MNKTSVLLTSTLLSMGVLSYTHSANADISSTITLTNDYDYRGVSQSAQDPALQASIDYLDPTHGWYVGAWGSNVDFGDGTDLQLNLYTGFTGTTDIGLGWNAGFKYQAYDKSKHNYPEIFTAFSYSYFKAKLSYTNDFNALRNTSGNTSVLNLSTEAVVPLPVKDLTALAHIGHSTGNNGFDDYSDFSVGVGYKIQKFDLALKFIDTDASPHTQSDVFNNESRLVFTVATTLPW